MSFWSTSDGKTIDTSGEFDSNPELEVIPENTCVPVMATEFKIEPNEGEYSDQKDGSQLVKVRWDVYEGEYKGRVIFQKLYLWANEDKKRDKAIRMLAAIDANAQGGLMQSGQEPTEYAMAQALCNKPQIIQLGIWNKKEKDENGQKVPGGNWVRAVYNKAKGAPAAKPAAQAPAPNPANASFDDDIDF